MRKNRAVAAAAAGLLLAVIAAVVWMAAGVDRYRGAVQAAVAERLGRDVSLGPLHVSFFPLAFRVERVVIADDPAFQTTRPFAKAEELYVTLQPFALLRGRVDVRTLELRRPAIELVRNAAGTWNVTPLGGRGKGAASAIHRLAVTDGRVAVTDVQKPQASAVYDHIDLELEDYKPGSPFDIVLAATLPGEAAERLSLRGTAGPLEEKLAASPFEGEVQFEEVSLSGLQRFLQVKALEGADAVISGRADLNSRDGQVASKGSLRLERARTRSMDIGYPIAADFDLTHDASSNLLTIASGRLRLDDTPLSLAGTIDLQPDTPSLDVRVKAPDVSLAEVARLASAFGVAFGADTQAEGRLQADLRAYGPVARPAFDGRLQLRDVNISGAAVARPVRTEAVDLALTPDEIRSNDFSATTNGTTLAARVVVRKYTTAAPEIDATLRTTGADLGDVLNIGHAWGVRAVDGVSGTGRVAMNVRMSGPAGLRTYGGKARLDDATVQTPAITQPLRIRSAAVTFTSNGAVLDGLVASIGKTTADGSVTVRDFASPQVTFDLSADRIDVAEMQHLSAPAGKTPAAQGEESLLRRTSGSGRVRVGAMTYQQVLLEHVDATATLDRGVIRLDPLTAGLYGGRHRGAVAIDVRRTPAAIAVASTLEQVDANRLLSAVSTAHDVIFGALGSVVRLDFSTDGAASIARSLNGTLSLDLPKGRIPNVDLLNEIAAIARFVTGAARTEPSTNVTSVKGHFRLSGGVARTDDLTATVDGGVVSAAGAMNLVDHGLDVRVTAVLARDVSRRAGGAGVGGFMSTVLANQQGELVVPMHVTGTMEHPRFAPDVQRIAEMKLRNMVPTLGDPQDWTAAILGAIGGRQDDGRTQPPAAPTPQPKKQKDPAKEIEDALRQLLGTGKQGK